MPLSADSRTVIPFRMLRLPLTPRFSCTIPLLKICKASSTFPRAIRSDIGILFVKEMPTHTMCLLGFGATADIFKQWDLFKMAIIHTQSYSAKMINRQSSVKLSIGEKIRKLMGIEIVQPGRNNMKYPISSFCTSPLPDPTIVLATTIHFFPKAFNGALSRPCMYDILKMYNERLYCRGRLLLSHGNRAFRLRW